MCELRDIWESTSFSLEKLQCNPECVTEEQTGLKSRIGPSYKLTFTPTTTTTTLDILNNNNLLPKHKIAVIRQEGNFYPFNYNKNTINNK